MAEEEMEEVNEEELATENTVAGKRRRTLKESVELGLPIWVKVRADELSQVNLDEVGTNSSDFKAWIFGKAGIKVMSTARKSTGLKAIMRRYGITSAEELEKILSQQQ